MSLPQWAKPSSTCSPFTSTEPGDPAFQPPLTSITSQSSDFSPLTRATANLSLKTTDSRPGDLDPLVQGAAKLTLEEPSSPRSFVFLDLPPELRLCIYEYLWGHEFALSGVVSPIPALLQTCRLIRHEAGPLYGERVTLVWRHKTFSWYGFNRSVPPIICTYLTRLELRGYWHQWRKIKKSLPRVTHILLLPVAMRRPFTAETVPHPFPPELLPLAQNGDFDQLLFRLWRRSQSTEHAREASEIARVERIRFTTIQWVNLGQQDKWEPNPSGVKIEAKPSTYYGVEFDCLTGRTIRRLWYMKSGPQVICHVIWSRKDFPFSDRFAQLHSDYVRAVPMEVCQSLLPSTRGRKKGDV